jgi:hypothetical protein
LRDTESFSIKIPKPVSAKAFDPLGIIDAALLFIDLSLKKCRTGMT